jgi:hypothetical protein
MAYLGNTPDVNTYTLGVQKFSGTGACTQFSLSRNISDANTLGVVVNGVPQTPGDSYSVTGGIITFTEPPSISSNNIVVTYLATSVVTQIIPGQLLPGSVTQTALAIDSVTSDKIVAGSILGNDLAVNSVSGNNIGLNAVSGNNIVAGSITGNLIGSGAISGNNLGVASISANNIVPSTITGNLIANNAISGNNIVSPPDIFDDVFLFGGM